MDGPFRRTSFPPSRLSHQTILMPLSFERKPSLVAYLTCGDPNLATTRDIVLAAIDAGASVIELGRAVSAIRWPTAR